MPHYSLFFEYYNSSCAKQSFFGQSLDRTKTKKPHVWGCGFHYLLFIPSSRSHRAASLSSWASLLHFVLTRNLSQLRERFNPFSISFAHNEPDFLDRHQCTHPPSGRFSFSWSAPIKIYTTLCVQPQVTEQIRKHEAQDDESVLI